MIPTTIPSKFTSTHPQCYYTFDYYSETVLVEMDKEVTVCDVALCAKLSHFHSLYDCAFKTAHRNSDKKAHFVAAWPERKRVIKDPSTKENRRHFSGW